MRLLRLASDLARSNLGDPPLPFKLTFIATYRCQLRCSMCSIWRRPARGELTSGEIRRFFRAAPRFTWVNLSGGEIFLRDDADEIFAAVVEESPRLYLLDFPTHGFQSDRIVRSVERLARSRVPRILVTVSVDGPPRLHDRIRGKEGSWERAVETLRRLRGIRRRGLGVFAGMTLQGLNAGALDETLEALRGRLPRFRPRDLHVNLAHRSSHYYGNDHGSDGFELPGGEEARRAFARIRRLRGIPLDPVAWLERRYQALALRYLETGRTPLVCRALAASVFVDPTGEVYPCSMFDRKLGNLRDHDFDLACVLREARAPGLRREIRAGRCPHCWTPCEAFPTILASLAPRGRRRPLDGEQGA